MIEEAIKRSASFNIIHLKTTIKIDIFVPGGDLFQQNVLNRKHEETLVGSEKFNLSSPEDIILNKLLWYDKGGRVSERQLFDLMGVVKIQGDSFDKNYFINWARKLGIYDLLLNVFKDAWIKI